MPEFREHAPTPFRGDIQALRAFAVMAVIVNHLWVHRLTGGFIGVDIFFVISGFLISSHLFKDTLIGRRVPLLVFYARRIRRLLPAAFVVLALSTLGVIAVLPLQVWKGNFAEILSAAAYSENIYLAVQAVDYHAIGQKASVAQHYWSLSVEEQFYFLWPMLLMACSAIAVKKGANIAQVTAWCVGIFTLIFLAFSVWFTAYSPAQAYFVTPVRFWEFGIGALTALLVRNLQAPATQEVVPESADDPLPSRIQQRRVRTAQRHHLRRRAWIAGGAWGVLITSIFVYSPHIPFPSATALLPVVATAVIITMGTGAALPLLDRITSLRPVRWTGDISYSLYLWHWPLIVLAPEALGRTLTWRDKLVLLVITFVLAGLSKPFIEDAGMRWRFLTASTRRTFASMIAAITAFALTLTGAYFFGQYQISGEQERIAAQQAELKEQFEKAAKDAAQSQNDSRPIIDCFGPGALLNPQLCSNTYAQPLSTVLGPDNNWTTVPDECSVDTSFEAGKFGGVVICDYRDNPDVSRDNTILMVGDSHADQWKWAMYDIARRHKMRVESLMVGGCPVRLFPDEAAEASQTHNFGFDCTEGVKAITQYVSDHPTKRIFYSTYAKTEPLPSVGDVSDQQTLYSQAMTALWNQWLDAGSEHIYVMNDTPYNDAVRDVNCVTRAEDPVMECRVERAKALGMDPLPGAVKAANSPKITTIDMTDAFCDASFCYAVAGQLPVYFDPTHLNREYLLKLTPILEWELGLLPRQSTTNAQ